MVPRTRLLVLGSTLLGVVACGDDAPGGAGGSSSTAGGSTTSATTATSATSSGTGGSGTGGTGSGGSGSGVAGGPATSTGGAGGIGGEGAGGEGAGGEAAQGLCAGPPVDEPTPVPGCESLVWVGEPVAVVLEGWPRQQGALLDGGDVGLVHLTIDSGPVVSRRIASPFASWPPAISEAVPVLPGSSTGVVPFFSARSDGTFAVYTDGAGAVGTFGESTVGLRPDWGVFALDPRPGAGGFLVGIGTVEHFAAVVEGSVGVDVHTFEPGCIPPRGFVNDEGELMASNLRGAAGCNGPLDQLALLRARSDGGEDLDVLELGAPASDHRIVTRPGGAWLGLQLGMDLCVVPVDADGGLAGPALVTPTEANLSIAPWRGGLAFSIREDNTLAIGLTDGVNITRTPFLADDFAVPLHPLDLVASSDGRSVLATFDGFGPGGVGLYVARADCVADAGPDE